MICCKINADGTALARGFAGIMDGLSAKGSVLWMDRSLYFANVDDPSVTASSVARVLRKNGCAGFFVEEFNSGNQPRESEAANAWLLGKLAQIAWKQAVIQCGDELVRMSETIEALGADIDKLAAVVADSRRDADGRKEEQE